MGCIECEVPAAVTRGRGGARTLEKGKNEGGIWTADYAEQTELLAKIKRSKNLYQSQGRTKIRGNERRKVVGGGKRKTDGEEERDHLDSCVCKCVDRISQDGGESVGEKTNMVM